MALAQQPPRPHSYSYCMTDAASTKPKLSRRAGLEEYQWRVVEKIKRHLDKRRRQWETSLQKQAEVFSTSSSQSLSRQEEELVTDTHSTDSRSGAATSASDISSTAANDDADGVSQASSQSLDTEAELRVLRAHCDKQKGNVSRWKFELDISDFLPDGEVLISTGDRTLTATGHPAKRKSRSSNRAAVKMQMELDGEVDNRTMLVTTSSNGIMTIRVTVKQEKTNSVFYC